MITIINIFVVCLYCTYIRSSLSLIVINIVRTPNLPYKLVMELQYVARLKLKPLLYGDKMIGDTLVS